ncbi:uncharacterized protein LOC128217027 [Mya arenaria]|uniref:uncharacterized protein LOC128217027 n=1 Tax=Mya arenaria TaxID=6604 RepID=UPI0022E782F9|nr:uncharacterized protein LOC128217027 [Mya arenaria]
MESKLCDPCRFDETEEKATGFCVDCVEYLCSTCSRDHRRNKITRTHTILKDEDMPSDVSSFTTMKTMIKCKVHPDRTVEYKCSTHNELICVSCFTKAHRQCQTIDELTFEITKKQLESVAQRTKRLQKEIQECGDARLRMTKMLNENLVKLEKDCDQHAEGMKERIDTLNKKLKENIRTTIGVQVSSNEGDIDAMSSLQNVLSTKLKLVNDTQKYGNASEQEAVFKWTETNLKEVESQVQSYKKTQSKLYKFLPHPSLEKLSDLGQIYELDDKEITVVYEQKIASCSSEEVADEKNKERPEKDTIRSGVLRITEFSFVQNEILSCRYVELNPLVGQSCAIASLNCLPDGRVLVLDDVNKRLMVLNSEIGSVFCHTFHEKPVNFCVQPTTDKSKHYICVCFSGTNAIRRLMYFVVKKDNVTVDGGCFTKLQPVNVSPLGHQTVVFCGREIVDNLEIRETKTGRIVGITNVTQKARKVRVFEMSNKPVIFVLERNAVIVHGINKSKQLFPHTDWHIDLKGGEPTDVTVDEKNIYICCVNINCVYKISLSDKSKSKVIIENIEQPVAICYDKRNNQLVVGCKVPPVLYAFTFPLN